MLKNKLYVLSIFASVIFSQNIWGGHSVSTSDNLDAFSLNPAGFGLDRGSQTGLYIPTNDNGFEAFFSQRYSNFGYLVKYSDSQPDEMNWWEPLNYKVGLGFKAGRISCLLEEPILLMKTKIYPVIDLGLQLDHFQITKSHLELIIKWLVIVT